MENRLGEPAGEDYERVLLGIVFLEILVHVLDLAHTRQTKAIQCEFGAKESGGRARGEGR